MKDFLFKMKENIPEMESSVVGKFGNIFCSTEFYTRDWSKWQSIYYRYFNTTKINTQIDR
jgi:hypothetical protein